MLCIYLLCSLPITLRHMAIRQTKLGDGGQVSEISVLISIDDINVLAISVQCICCSSTCDVSIPFYDAQLSHAKMVSYTEFQTC
jgi:hypothetical protein